MHTHTQAHIHKLINTTCWICLVLLMCILFWTELIYLDGTGWPSRGAVPVVPGEDWISLPQQPLMACSSSLEGGALWDSPHPCCHVIFSGPVWAVLLLRFHGYNFPVIGRKALSHSGNPGPLPVIIFLPHVPQCSLSLRGGGYVVEEPVGARYPTVSCSLYVD